MEFFSTFITMHSSSTGPFSFSKILCIKNNSVIILVSNPLNPGASSTGMEACRVYLPAVYGWRSFASIAPPTTAPPRVTGAEERLASCSQKASQVSLFTIV